METLLRGFIEQSFIGVSILDEAGRIVEWNEANEQLTGFKREQVLGQFLWDVQFRLVLPKRRIPDRLASLQKTMVEALQTGKGSMFERTIEADYQDAAGNHRTILQWIFPVSTDRGTRVAILSHDITERKHGEQVLRQHSERLQQTVNEKTRALNEAEEKLVQKEKLTILGQLAGGVGHELRNPLGVMSNAVYFLKLIQPDADPKVKEYLGILNTEISNADRIVNDLLNFARIKPAEKKQVLVHQLIDQVLQKQPAPEGIAVTTKIPTTLPPVYIDHHQIGQVFLNLVTNAYQAMSQSGSLTISASAGRSEVRIDVADTGCGISPENLSRLFEPLFTTKSKGIGLGLVVTKRLLEANKGRIEVESKVGRGTTFTVWLPAPHKPEARGDENR